MHKGMRLTPEGEVLYQHVAQACEQIAIGEKKIQAMLHLDWGSIHIGSSDMIMHAFLLPYLERFHKDYPKVRISTITASTPETIASRGPAGSIWASCFRQWKKTRIWT